MKIDKKIIATNFTKGGNKRLGIVIHTMVGTLDGTNAWFNNPAAKASAHYGIDLDGSRVFQFVEESDQAYAQGIVVNPTFKMVLDRPNVNPNTYLISIECADNGDPSGRDRTEQYPAIIELVRDIAKRNNIPIDREHIAGHREIRANKTCPGNLDVDYIVKEAQGGQNMSTMYGGLNLDDHESMKIAVDAWNDIKNKKYVKKEDADRELEEAKKTAYDAGDKNGYSRGFDAGKAAAPTTSTNQSDPGSLVQVDSSVWEENGLDITTINGNQTIKVNYKRKEASK